jgi:hypothetical protein
MYLFMYSFIYSIIHYNLSIHAGVAVRPDAPPSELAVAVARHFEAMEVDETESIGGFLARLSHTGNYTDYARKTAFYDGHQYSSRKRNRKAARPGEQVAAKVTRTDENGSWILASVQRFYVDTDTYDVQDEDDTSKLIRLPWTHVMRLSTGTEGCFARGTSVMAIFPETTSFYRATVSKRPVWNLQAAASSAVARTSATNATTTTTPSVKEMIVKFEDDEDHQGRTPHRRVPARFVIPLPENYFYEEAEDVDLSHPAGVK